MQTDEAVWVVCQHNGIPVKPHLVHFGPHVVAGVSLAECLIGYCCYLVVLQKKKKTDVKSMNQLLRDFKCYLQMVLHVGARHEETLGGVAPK